MNQFDTIEDVARKLSPSYPVFCVRPHILKRDAEEFVARFPGRVLYAVKCNPHPLIMDSLYDAGIRHFDTASLTEVADTRNRYPSADLYFMHPVKARASIVAASRIYGVHVYAVDDMVELHKILEATKGEEIAIVCRIACSGDDVVYNLSAKFGATPDEAAEILKTAEAEGCQTGLCFHVGSQCTRPEAFEDALKTVGEVLDKAKVEIKFLDVGGGFPSRYLGAEIPPLCDYVEAIENGISKLNLRRDCVVMCEPGRALVAQGMSLLTQVLLRKGDKLYINDGIYGGLQETVAGGMDYPVRLIRPDQDFSSRMTRFSIYGPTCDSLDVLPKPMTLPDDIREGDWIEISSVGAYSNAVRTQFNGFYPDTFVQVNDSIIVK